METLEIPFRAFAKIPRLKRTLVVTEKIDGTNAGILINDEGAIIRVQSRTRFITPTDDNFGFAGWVSEHNDELRELGPGLHFGEWWGMGIQRKYGLKNERRFSLFNTGRWLSGDGVSLAPSCCSVVPLLGQSELYSVVDDCLDQLREYGSVAAPGFKPAEGVVVYHSASRHSYKVTLDNDKTPKGA